MALSRLNLLVRLQTLPRILVALVSFILGAISHRVLASQTGAIVRCKQEPDSSHRIYSPVQIAASLALVDAVDDQQKSTSSSNEQTPTESQNFDEGKKAIAIGEELVPESASDVTKMTNSKSEQDDLETRSSQILERSDVGRGLPTLEELATKFRTGTRGRIHAETKELHFGGDKGCRHHCYTPYYNEKFSPLRGKDGLKFLEIGVMAGDSLALWSLFFQRAGIYGVDIATDTFQKNLDTLKKLGAFPNGDPKVLKADPTREQGAAQVIGYGPFDVIIDDGSHTTIHILGAFKQLFLRAIKPGGLYCIEDLEHFHLPLDQQNRRKDFFWNIIESSQWRGSNMLKREHMNKFINKKVVDASHGVSTLATDLETWIETVEFHRQICCIRIVSMLHMRNRCITTRRRLSSEFGDTDKWEEVLPSRTSFPSSCDGPVKKHIVEI